LDVNAVQLEFKSNPNMAFQFYRWLATILTRKNDRSLTIKEAMIDTTELDSFDGVSASHVPKSDILEMRGLVLAVKYFICVFKFFFHQTTAAEKRKHQLAALREKFGVPSDEPVLHVAGDLFRRESCDVV
jgi:hypothetical protein